MNLLQQHWHNLPEADLRRLQAEKLRQYLRNVLLPFSPHYRRQFQDLGLTADSIRTLDDLEKIPFATKADLLSTPDQPQRFRDFVVVPDPKVLSHRPGTILNAMLHGRVSVKRGLESEYRPIFMTFTTGRSAEPTPVLYTQRDLDHLAVAGGRLMEICAARREDRMLNLFPFSPHLAFWLTHYAGVAGGVLMLSSGGGKVMGTDGNLRLLRKVKPDVIIGIPTFIYHLLQQAVDEKLPCENLRRIVLGGEKVSDGLRQKLIDLGRELGSRQLDVVATYGFTEAKMAWPECPFPHGQSSGGYHLFADLGILEIVDPKTGKILPPETPGEIVFTPLDARGTVLLRYRTGDCTDGGITYQACPHCGRTLPRLLGNISRKSEVKEMHLDKIKGTLVDFNELEHVLDDIPSVGAWQVELRKVNDDPHEMDEIILHVHNANGLSDDQLRQQLREHCYTHLEIHPNRIEFHSNEEMRQLQGVGRLLKEQKVVDHRPAAGNNNGNGHSAAVTATAGETTGK
jgi:phenylacetate-coenzyme A ligase PaaK-like adenylate-forming protein